jgi:hypothetical protein
MSAEVWIAIRTDGYAGSGTVLDPYDGSTLKLFDRLMESVVEANTLIHLGPGIFQTQGWVSGVGGGWKAKSGQKVRGAGIYATVLKLVNATTSTHLTSAISGDNFLRSFEVSDLTIDCNLDGQPLSADGFPSVCCSAIDVIGSKTLIRRVRAIHFGGQQKTATPVECFVFSPCIARPDYPETVNCLIEDCIAEWPSINGYDQITCVLLGAAERETDGVMAYHRGCAIHNSYFNLEHVDNPVPIQGITISDTAVTVTTKSPHKRAVGSWVVVSGALLEGDRINNFNGSYQITEIISSTVFKYTIFVPSGGTPPTSFPTGGMYIGKFSSAIVPLQALSVEDVGSEHIATLATEFAHNRIPGNSVALQGILPTAYDGPFLITEVISPFKLKYKMDTNPGEPELGGTFNGITLQAISIDSGVGAIAESNRVLNCGIGGPYHDSYSAVDHVARKNYFYNVAKGPFQNMVSTGLSRTGTSLTHVGAVAYFTASLPHGYITGQAVIIAGASVGTYNGSFAITVVSATQFSYPLPSNPGSDSAGTFTFRVIYQVGRLVMDKNIVESSLFRGSGFGYPIAISMSGAERVNPYVFGQLFFRGNVIRAVGNEPAESLLSGGIQFNSAQNSIAKNNLIDLNQTPFSNMASLFCAFSHETTFLNNSNVSGKLIQGWDGDVGHPLNELGTNVELECMIKS